jgi:hypothetical protein
MGNEATIVYYGSQIGMDHVVLGPMFPHPVTKVRSGKLPHPYLAMGNDLGNVMVEAQKATIEPFN